MSVEQFEAGKLYKKLPDGEELVFILSVRGHNSALYSPLCTSFVLCVDCYGVFHAGTVGHENWILVE
jgi:hypothetical protein